MKHNESWLNEQIHYWYHDLYPLVIDGNWKFIWYYLKRCHYGSSINDFLSIDDNTPQKINKCYNGYSAYQSIHHAEVLKEWVKYDRGGRFTLKHRFPILMTDSIKDIGIIGYNRRVNTPSILWPLYYHHNDSLCGLRDTQDFDEKINKIIFRGALSNISRFEIICKWQGKEWADLGLTLIPEKIKQKQLCRNKEADILLCMRDIMPKQQVLKYKYVLCLEGANISTGFGWALASNCVPIHPYPFHYEVWYFNGLQPWVHFIPLLEDGRDLEDVFEWCENHPDKCREIAQNGRTHMKRMLDMDSLDTIKEGVVKLWDLKED
jgi:hypothetical protein